MPQDPSDPRSWFPLRVATLSFARDCLHVREEGYNRGKMVEVFQGEGEINPGDPWCAAFVNWCAKKAAELKGIASPLERVPLQGYVQSYVEYARRNDWLRGEEEDIGVGDLVACWFPSKGRYAHIGFVEEVERSTIKTIEGNTGPDGGREGDGVYSRIRDVKREKMAFIDWTRDLDEGAA